MRLISFLLFFSLPVLASDIDQKLQGYIKEFGLKPLHSPPARNQALFSLGQKLFTTNLLSGNKNIGCVHCHHPGVMTHDALPLAIGEGALGIQIGSRSRDQHRGKILARNTPAVFNLHAVHVLFWDGRISFDPSEESFTTPLKQLNGKNPKRSDITRNLSGALAAQSIFPIVDFAEMRGQPGSNPIADAEDEFAAWDLVIEQIMKSEIIKKDFAAAFPGEKMNIGHVGTALAEFQIQAFAFNDTPYDRYLKGDVEALSEKEKKGMDVFFGVASCGNCHNREQLSSLDFENVGIPQIGPGKKNGDDLGRQEVDPASAPYRFRVPPLRNVALTAPYMHNGVFADLPAVISHYENVIHSLRHFQWQNTWPNYVEEINEHDHSRDRIRLQALSSNLSPRRELSAEQKDALLEFLQTALTDIRLHDRIPR